ncbi:enoyl-CoA hydratase family protein [Nordella sp. HKS 07]|uniref:enoyl-CoA hydratase family protein n=1 Tax=Nordella sp. HKS 07 TaxID=2712222 RepID=UPI0013E12137|nr:enoyl-CoA hydratase family protein [Nordella sp. HKS 07]QIG47711.1 enoyl-CoA hydratase family protein [Nordella sp. HKS 07]
MNRTHWVTPPLSTYQARHVLLTVTDGVAAITLNRPEKKNPLTFDSYDELTAIFAAARKDETTHAFVISGAGGNFSSGGDVLEIIGPLTEMNVPQLLRFTEMTGDLVKTMRACPQPIISAIDGICAGAGAIIAMASDLRLGTEAAKVAFLFNRVGLAGCDMGACAMLPRIIGQGRASELLFTGRALGGAEAERWGFFNRLVDPASLIEEATKLARQLVQGPTFANGMTKRMLQAEWAMSIDDAVEAEAIAQALCMKTEDFRRAYEAFAAKQKPVFKGN